MFVPPPRKSIFMSLRKETGGTPSTSRQQCPPPINYSPFVNRAPPINRANPLPLLCLQGLSLATLLLILLKTLLSSTCSHHRRQPVPRPSLYTERGKLIRRGRNLPPRGTRGREVFPDCSLTGCSIQNSILVIGLIFT